MSAHLISLTANLGASLEFVLEVKGEKDGKAPRREDFNSEAEYQSAYLRHLEDIGVDPQTISRVRRAFKEPWIWKKGHPGDRE